MEKTHLPATNIVYFFIGVLICSLIGFHFTYTMRFPTFEGLSVAHHFHGATLMLWFLMLIVQPILIRKKKFALHRKVGKISYLLVPLILFSIFWVTKVSYLRNIASQPQEEVIGGLALDIPTIFIFGSFYFLAMLNRRNSAAHMRYMVGTSLLMIGPGLGRALIIFGGISFPMAIIYTTYFAEFIAILFIINDYIKGNSIKPYLTILFGLLFLHACWIFKMTALSQWFGSFFAKVFFE